MCREGGWEKEGKEKSGPQLKKLGKAKTYWWPKNRPKAKRKPTKRKKKGRWNNNRKVPLGKEKRTGRGGYFRGSDNDTGRAARNWRLQTIITRKKTE